MDASESDIEPLSIFWDGAFVSGNQDKGYKKLVSALAREHWPELLSLCESERNLLYTVIEPKGKKGGRWSTILHESLRMSCPDHVVNQLLALGALCSVRDARGLLPWQVADKLERTDDAKNLRRHVPELSLFDMRTERVLQGLISSYLLEAALNVVPDRTVRLPEVIALREKPGARIWFPILGMMGGFHFWWESCDSEISPLMVEAWSRMEGVVSQWRITPDEAVPIRSR